MQYKCVPASFAGCFFNHIPPLLCPVATRFNNSDFSQMLIIVQQSILHMIFYLCNETTKNPLSSPQSIFYYGIKRFLWCLLMQDNTSFVLSHQCGKLTAGTQMQLSGHPKCIRNTWKGSSTCESWGCAHQLLVFNQKKSAQTAKALNGQPWLFHILFQPFV